MRGDDQQPVWASSRAPSDGVAAERFGQVARVDAASRGGGDVDRGARVRAGMPWL